MEHYKEKLKLQNRILIVCIVIVGILLVIKYKDRMEE